MSDERRGWQYTALDVSGATSIDQLNELGAEGWELVSVDQGKAILKRPLSDLSDIVTADQRARVYGQLGSGVAE